MRKLTLILGAICLFTISAIAQSNQYRPDRLKVFMDCQNAWCDMNYIKTEITLVDFMLDNKAADVHVLVTEQNTGSGGSQYQLIFFGQNGFSHLRDTLQFSTANTATDFEVRAGMIRYIKLGLAPFIARTRSASQVMIDYKQSADAAKKDTAIKPAKDPWNYWVYRISTNGNISADEVYKSLQYSGNLSANRTTDEWKIAFRLYGSKNKTTYDYETSSGNEKFTVNNHNIGFEHYLIKSINSHWSYGYQTTFNQSTFSNFKGQTMLKAAVEYDIFPYKDVNNKLFTISYGIDNRIFRYYDTTIYEKTKESLPGHGVDVNMTFNQKWGTAFFGISYHNYFKDWKYFNLGINAFTSIRITGGLSFNVSAFGGLTRDQLFLPKGGATEEEVLTRRRQLASGYSYYTSFGISYRFGSKVNNFVNPRFEGGNN